MSDITNLKTDLDKTTAHLKEEFAKLQTGRANAALVEGVLVEVYGQKQPLKAVATITVPDGRSLLIQPWDKSALGEIEKALEVADLGTNPVNEGAQIRIVFPPMTEERRKQMVKHVKDLAEEAHIAVRQHRQEHHSNAKKDESRSEDEHRDFEENMQKEIDVANKEIDAIAEKKEEDVMTV